MISHKHKFIFVHIPKTGGTSIECVFDNSALVRDVQYKHHTLEGYESLNKSIAHYFKFSFVRNPWDMTTSMYNYLWDKKAAWPRRWRKNNKKFSQLSFREWITHTTFQSPTIRSVDVVQYKGSDGDFSSWLTGKKSTVDFVGRFENFQEDFDTVCDKIGIPKQELPHRNKLKHKHYTEYYDDETREIVAKKYAKDIDYFGYEFGK